MDEFNHETESIAYDCWVAGVEINHDGQFVNIDTALAMGIVTPDVTIS